MKFLVVVLALAASCLAEPEADPGYFYNRPSVYGSRYSGHGHYPSASSYYHRIYKRDAEADPAAYLLRTPASTTPLLPYGYPAPLLPYGYPTPLFGAVAPGPISAPVAAPAPISVPLINTAPAPLPVAAPAPISAPFINIAPASFPVAAPIAGAAPAVVAPQLFPYTQHDCVTPGGCAALTLRTHGLAKREADAEADAEAEALFYGSFYNPYAYSPFYNHYNGYYNGYAPAYPRLANAVPAVPYVQSLKPAPLPVVRQPIVAPVIGEVHKPVTYTHLGAHPLVNPATVVEKHAEVVGHTVY